MKLSTVIVNYNTRDKLARALDSLLEAGGVASHEIIVVDNASTDGSAALVRERFPSVRLIEPGANRWFSGGNNLGFRAAQGEYVHILNPDTVVLPGALPAMFAALDADPSLGAVTSRMTYDDGTLQRNCSRRVTYTDLVLGYTFVGALLPGWRDRRRARMWYAEWDRESDWDVEIAPGSNILARGDVLRRIGGFDDRLKLYFTEDDLCVRIAAEGCGIRYLAGATIIHDEHASTESIQRLATRIYFDDLITYTRLHFGAARARVLAALVRPTRAAMALRQRLRG